MKTNGNTSEILERFDKRAAEHKAAAEEAWKKIQLVARGQAEFIDPSQAAALNTWLEQVQAGAAPLSTKELEERAIQFAANIRIKSVYKRGKGR